MQVALNATIADTKFQRSGYTSTLIDTDRLPKRYIWDRNYIIDYNSMSLTNKNRGKFEYGGGPDLFQIFTDGSLHDGIAGSGVNIEHGAVQLSFNIGRRSIFQAELYAIQKACQWIIKNNDEVSNKNVTLYDDEWMFVEIDFGELGDPEWTPPRRSYLRSYILMMKTFLSKK